MNGFYALAPAVLGGLFALTVKIDHALFYSGTISPRGAIGIELVVFLLFAVSVIAALIFAIRSAFARRGMLALLALFSIAVGTALFVFGIDSGSALLYAT